MIKYFLFITLAALASCATNPEKRKVMLNQIQTDMASLNTVLRGRLAFGEIAGEISKLDSPNYRVLALENAADSEKEYVDFLKKDDTEIAVSTGTKKFAVCIKNISVKIIVCDFTGTNASTDFDSEDMTIDIKTKVKEFSVE